MSQHEETVLEIIERNPDFTLRRYCEEVLEKLGVNSNISMMDRFLKQHDISLKKTYRSEKAITKEVRTEGLEYWRRILKVETEKLVFIDEIGFWVGMSSRVARAKSLSWLRRSGVVATRTLEGSMKKDDFLEFIKVDLVPKLKASDDD